MTHIEDKVLYGGVKGTREAIMALRSLRDMLGGDHASNVSVKWDGAPAVFAGTDPSDGRFFVAKKGIFNKSPKVYKSDADIDADTSGDLNAKLKLALQYLPELGIKGVIQGDFLYGPGDVKRKKIDGWHGYGQGNTEKKDWNRMAYVVQRIDLCRNETKLWCRHN